MDAEGDFVDFLWALRRPRRKFLISKGRGRMGSCQILLLLSAWLSGCASSRAPAPRRSSQRIKGSGGRARNTLLPPSLRHSPLRVSSRPGYLRNLGRPRTIALEPSGGDSFATDFSAITAARRPKGKEPFGPPLADPGVTWGLWAWQTGRRRFP